MAHSDRTPSKKKALRTRFLPTVLPSSVTSDTSPLQNKILTYRRCNEQQKKHIQLLVDRALKAHHVTMEEKFRRGPVPPVPELPSTMNSEQRERAKIYLFMKERVQSRPMAPIPQEWLTSILTRVPQALMEGEEAELLTQKLLEEIIMDYEKSMRRYMVQSVLIKPDIKGLEDEMEEPLPSLPL